MIIDQEEINRIVLYPGETRSIEIKSWIDPRSDEDKSKLLTAILALRNFNGGHLLIGFDDKSLQPFPAYPADILDAYTNDSIQGLVSRHASETFDVAIGFGMRNGQRHPVIAVVSGVRTPVAVRVPINRAGGKPLIKKGVVFFRTLNANGTVSSAEAQPSDWPEITQICMDNREADIGRFVRRHLAGLDLTQIIGTLGSMKGVDETPPTLIDKTQSWLNDGAAKATAAVRRWPLQPYPGNRPDIKDLLRVGAWEVALVIDPPISGWIADNAFYQTVASSIPDYSSWPIWRGTRGSADATSRHQQLSDGWEAFAVSVPKDFWANVEFQRWEPSGRFYLRRLHDDDASAEARHVALGRTLDLGRVASRVAEAMMVGLAIGKALNCPEDTTQLSFAFRWTALAGRVPAFWGSGLRFTVVEHEKAIDDEATAVVSVPLGTAPAAVSPFVLGATRSLFAKFDGFSVSMGTIDRCVQFVFDRQT